MTMCMCRDILCHTCYSLPQDAAIIMKLKFTPFWPKIIDYIVRVFDQKLKSSVVVLLLQIVGAMKLKFAPFCSP